MDLYGMVHTAFLLLNNVLLEHILALANAQLFHSNAYQTIYGMDLFAFLSD